MKKAVVFDNSGTLLERYRVIKDIENNILFTNMNSLDLINSHEGLALVVLQFNTSYFLNIPQNTLISNIIKKHNIKFDITFTTIDVSEDEIKEIIENDKKVTVKEITDGFSILKEKIPKMEICNGSALIVDIKSKSIAFTITSAGKLFKGVKHTINTLKKRDIEIYIASGDRKGAIKNLASILNINNENAFGSVNTKGKCEIINKLQKNNFKVMMVGDGINDILAFENADVSVLTVQQKEEVSPKLLNKTDFIVDEISEILDINF